MHPVKGLCVLLFPAVGGFNLPLLLPSHFYYMILFFIAILMPLLSTSHRWSHLPWSQGPTHPIHRNPMTISTPSARNAFELWS